MKSAVNLYVNAVFPDGQIVQVGRILSRNLEGKAFGLSHQKSKQLLRDVVQKISNWQDIFDRCGCLIPILNNYGSTLPEESERFQLLFQAPPAKYNRVVFCLKPQN